MYENKKILILGAGKSGISVAKLLAGKNNRIVLSDINPLKKEEKDELAKLNIEIIITDNQLDLIDESWDLIIKNPAIMYTSDITKKINDLNIRLEQEMEVAYHFLPKDIKIVGITGSNGKTTTTTIVYELLKKMGKSVVLGGNIGYALCEVLSIIKSGDILVLEISDHQLCDFHDFKTDISVLTNIYPTHLDYHGSFEHYKNTKKRIFNLHTKNNLAIINYNNQDSLDITNDILSKKIYFNNEENYIKNGKIYLNNKMILDTNEIKIEGQHNYEDILAALLVVNEFDLDMKVVRSFLKNFKGVEHRLEYICTKNGVSYYNDSKSTNPSSTITALKTFDKPIHLILGGLDRKQDFNELNAYLKHVKCIYGIGEVTEQVGEYANKRNILSYNCYTLADALDKIKKNATPGDIVLLSPGSSSQDQYLHFEDRGLEFKEMVEKF